MKPLFVLLTAALLSIGTAACGSTGKGASSTSHSSSSSAVTNVGAATTASRTTPTEDLTKVDSDRDNDVSAPYDDKSHLKTLSYGHEASAADAHAITKLVKRYYTVAAAGDGTKACALIASTLAESVPEDFGHGSAGPSYLSAGTTCPAVMDLLFKHFHALLMKELSKLEVAHVRLIGHRGYAILHFGTLPEREISLGREGRTWKIQSLRDSELP